MEQHAATVAQMAARVRTFHNNSRPFRIYHGSTLSTRASSRQRDSIIDTSSLSHVLRFDRTEKTVLVEPNVPMDALVDAALKEGLLPKVVMELPNITVGGGFAGTSGESSSFRYGLFDRSIRRIELVLGNGDVIWAGGDDADTRDLFYACAGSCGSLGVITLLEMELMDAKPYVELTYKPVGSAREAVRACREAERDPTVDYMDGIMFSMNRGVIMLGKLTAEVIQGRIQTFDRAFDPWLYLHAEDVLRRIEEGTGVYKESIPIKTYLFRYDRGVFWSGLRAFDYFGVPFNRITRYLLDPFMNSRTMVHALHRSGLSSQAIIQDLAVPYDGAEELLKWTDDSTGLWPLWLCPVKPGPGDERSFSMGKTMGQETLLDVGVWGMGPKDGRQFIKLNRDLEAKVAELGGLKCLYAHAYYTEDEFWRIYDEQGYTGLRRKYHAESLPSVYDKVKVDLRGVAGEQGQRRRISWGEWARNSFWETWPFGGLYGVASATKGLLVKSDFLLKR
ncbi:24-dehydrocholesterol reductase-like protein precursor [Trematosphaeria pertusa]|uniref:Delta(24)-sterol reductase n=1 Tax=Trematosphaeria pertusa TaxID=390896 RepID=A0A6A6IXX5_9PLEO|nr:24-dehydrocholesterol reductase-like protein precursor [Trematosphaeria pertusa]KAF2255158.1 24-dehydrocholesterol reductase-like protein precursor [Trematosphaeria pertusa]